VAFASNIFLEVRLILKCSIYAWWPGHESGTRWSLIVEPRFYFRSVQMGLTVDRFADFIRELLVVSVSISFHQCSIRTLSPIPDAIQILAAETVVK
jgi:hypothetical protein